MKNGLVIADAGPIFSLAIIEKLEILNSLFNEIKIPLAVWNEINIDKSQAFYNKIKSFFQNRVLEIKGVNDLSLILDYGESEAVILYRELNALCTSMLLREKPQICLSKSFLLL